MKRLLFLVIVILLKTGTVDAKKICSAVHHHANYALNDQQGDVNIVITPSQKDGNFTNKTEVKYKLVIKNNLPEEQEGAISYLVTNINGDEQLNKSFDLKIPKNKKLETSFTIPLTTEGEFTIVFDIELNKKKYDFNYRFVYTNTKKSKAGRKVETATQKTESDTEQQNEAELEGEIKTIVKPAIKDGVFTDNTPVIYNVQLQNTYRVAQEGTLRYTVKEAVKGTVVAEKIYDIKLAKRSTKNIKFNISAPPQPGIYNLELAINTNAYDDTTHYAFGYNIAQINNPYYKPTDFDEFWKKALSDLAAVDPAYHIEEDPEQSTRNFKVFRVDMNSLEYINIHGWLTIPRTKLGGNFPIVVAFGGYQINLKPLFFDDFVSFAVNVRGADKENMADINPDKQELLTLNINDPSKYVYRGIYMDCVRAINFLYDNENLGLDLSRIAVFGGSQGGSLALITAALMDKKIQTCVADNPTYCDFHLNLQMEPQIREESFILKYINKYLAENANFVTRADLLQTLSYFEIQNFIPKIKCPVLFGIGLLDPLAPAVTTIGAYNKLNPEVKKNSEIYVFPELAHEVPERHNTFKSIWFYEKLAKGNKK